MNHLGQVKQTLVDAQTLLKSAVLVYVFCFGSLLPSEVVGDLLATSQVYEVEVALGLQVVVSLLLEVDHVESKHGVRSARAVIEEGFCVVLVCFSNLDQLKYLIKGVDFHLVRSLNQEFSVLSLDDIEAIFDVLLLDDQQIIHNFIVDFYIAQFYLKLHLLIHLTGGLLNLLDFVEEILHGVDQQSRVLLDVVKLLSPSRDHLTVFVCHWGMNVGSVVCIFVLSSLMSHHGISFSCSCLSVDKHGSIDTIQRRQCDLLDLLLVNVQVGVSFSKHRVYKTLRLAKIVTLTYRI